VHPRRWPDVHGEGFAGDPMKEALSWAQRWSAYRSTASSWSSTPRADEAAKIKQPVLFVSGAESLPVYLESRDLFCSWRPHTEDEVMPGANHLLHMRHPADAAARLTDFLKRHAVTA
jgi:pimeloyl-ACP methyl ester carboxylesterase